jgi:hypothetical protein
VSDEAIHPRLKLAKKANFFSFSVAPKRVITQTTRLPIEAATVMLTFNLVRRMEAVMGDKSLKSKQRDQKHKDAAKTGTASAAKSKQDSYTRLQQTATKGKK